jgi:hypothetical protein
MQHRLIRMPVALSMSRVYVCVIDVLVCVIVNRGVVGRVMPVLLKQLIFSYFFELR